MIHKMDRFSLSFNVYDYDNVGVFLLLYLFRKVTSPYILQLEKVGQMSLCHKRFIFMFEIKKASKLSKIMVVLGCLMI